MATATLTSQLTDVSLDPGSPTNLGTGNAQASETAIQLQGANCAATGHSGSVGPTSNPTISTMRGMYATVTSFTRTGQHLHCWVRDLYPIRNANLGGVSVYIFGSSEAAYFITGLDRGYNGGWQHVVLNLDPGDRPAASTGTAPSANITRVGYVGNISVSKGEDFLQNCYLDAIRRGGDGQGITLRGGTTGDRLTFANCAAADTNSYGLFRNVGGSFIVEGPVTWGVSGQDTYLSETLKTINFANLTVNNGTGGNTVVSAVASDYYSLTALSGGAGATVIDFTDVTFNGVAAAPFDFIFGLTSSGNDSYTGVRNTFINMNDLIYASGCSSTDERFVNAVGQIWPASIVMTRPVFTDCAEVLLTASGSGISGGSTNGHTTTSGVAFMTTDSLSKISNHDFDNTGGVGHAIEITTPGTYTFTGNQFTGYGATASNDAAIYNNSGGAVTINVAGGGASPTYRNGAGASTTVNANVSVTLTGLKDNTEVRILDNATGAILDGIENATAGTVDNRSFTFALGAGTIVDIAVFNIQWILAPNNRIENFTIPATDSSIPLSQIIDRTYNNP